MTTRAPAVGDDHQDARAARPGRVERDYPLTVLRDLPTTSQKTVLVGVNRGLGTVAQAQAGQDAGEMVLHRALGQEQARRDLAVRRAARDQAQDIGLPRGQLAWLPRLDGHCPVGRRDGRLGQDWLRWIYPERSWLALTVDCRRQPADRLGAELGNAGMSQPDGGRELGGGQVLE